MQIQVTKLRLLLAALVLVAAGAGITSVLRPLGDSAFATAGQVVNVSDPTLANTARVDGNGALKVAGAVNATPTLPVSPWSNEIALFGGPATGSEIARKNLAETVGSKRLSVTALTVRSEDYGGPGKIIFNFRFWRSPPGVTTCPTDGSITSFALVGHKDSVIDTPSSFLELTFPTGWSARGTSASNQVVCLDVIANFFDPSVDRALSVQGSGFLQ